MPKLTTYFEQEKQCGRTHIPWFQHYHKVTVVTTVWYCHKDKIINQWKRVQGPAIPSHIWSKDFWQSGKIIQWRKDSIPPKRWWENLTAICQGMRLSSAQSLSRVRLFATPWTSARRTSCSSPTPRVYSNSCPLNGLCHPTVSSSVDPFSSHLRSFPASGSFQMRQLFTSGGQSTGVSASASVPPPNIQNWLPLR